MTEQAGPAQPPRDPLDWAEPLPDAEVERALVVTAHPDDADFGAAGTMAGWVDAGIEVTLLLCTRGEQGGFDDTPRTEMPRIREREQRAASAALGVTDVRFLDGYSDGWLEPTWELQHQIVRVLRQVRPQRVLCQSPQRMLQRLQASHPDHLAAGEATVRAVYPASENRVRLARADRRGARAVEGHRALADGPPRQPARRRHHRPLRPQGGRAARARVADRAPRRRAGADAPRLERGNAARAGLAAGRLAETFAVSRIN